MPPKTNTKHVFDVGDRVIGNGIQDNTDIAGLVGTIVGIRDDDTYHVEFDEPHKYFHSCGGLARRRHGWNCRYDVLLPYYDSDWAQDAVIPELTGLLV